MYHTAVVAEAVNTPAAPRGRYALAMAGLWLLACLVLLALHAQGIASFALPDVDDQLRLVEVRDWLGGQSFYDISQHRMNAPFGAPMHWSRLVDMPIAALILALRPLLGAVDAERVTVVAMPLITLGVVMLCTGLIARRLAGRAAGLLATALLPTAVATVIQLQPMRIDHHGWEIALSLAGLAAALGDKPRRAGLLAGLAVATALQISLEALPFAVALGGVLGLHWMLAPARDTRDRLIAYTAMLALAEATLFGALHTPDQWGVFCDAVSPPHLLALAIAAVGVALVAWRDPAALWQRVAGLGLVAIVGGAAFHLVPPGCGVDAFSALEPIVRTYWYQKIGEGQPVWHQDAATAIGVVGFPLVALPCAIVAWRAERRVEWAIYAAMLAAATLVALTVLRAGALANALAIPAACWVILRLLARVQRSAVMPVRVFGSVAVLIAFSPWAAGAGAALVFPDTDAAKPAKVATPSTAPACQSAASLAALSVLPPSRIFAPFDFGPGILLATQHSVLASSHHRNHVAMAQELTAMLGSDDTAHAVLHARGMGYVLACPDTAESDSYIRAAPHGFAAHLEANRAPAWLTPVIIPGATFRLWKVAG